MPVTRKPWLLAYLVGTGGAQAVVAFQRSKGEENGFADVWGERLPARMGLWAVRAKSSLEKVRGG